MPTEAQQHSSIKQLSIGELMDGRYFYVPAYQRGYRWKKNQVEDLLRDLLAFTNEKKQNDFYSLQPVIARKINRERLQKTLHDNVTLDAAEKRGIWEIVDGQQRITTILILYRYLLDKLNIKIDDNDMVEGEGKQLYHVIYETRPGLKILLDHKNKFEELDCDQDVDTYHLCKAYEYIGNFIDTEGKKYVDGGSVFAERSTLFGLLNGATGAYSGSVQITWYQLPSEGNIDVEHEFQKINSGKIKLTDAELIKGLLLRGRNFDANSIEIKQEQSALEWENIENILQNDAFWRFLTKEQKQIKKGENTESPSRIDLIFNLISKEDSKEEAIDIRQYGLFRYYNDKLEHKEGKELSDEISKIWADVRRLFWILKDWYENPITYNYIGLLTQFDVNISEITKALRNIEGNEGTHEDFIVYLKQKIVSVGLLDKNCEISYSNRDKRRLKNTLLAANVALLNRLYVSAKEKDEMGDFSMYKFPFAAYSKEKWDIEHIDSYTDTPLEDDTEAANEWIKQTIEDLGINNEIKESLSKMNCHEQINKLRILAGETVEVVNPEIKNSIGNLALLNQSINRSYKNMLFCIKRKRIIKEIEAGTFVPLVTQYIFFKLFDTNGTALHKWSENDMQCHKEYIKSLISDYFNI